MYSQIFHAKTGTFLQYPLYPSSDCSIAGIKAQIQPDKIIGILAVLNYYCLCNEAKDNNCYISSGWSQYHQQYYDVEVIFRRGSEYSS